ncbi:hypothetical protein [Pseudonocardia sp. N23]|uniref:hypothetical protein n=1 Tax=Pseudonocardia sp. N23 TaxID=1987376 RepID=UPI000C033CC4|nr:hypothetical protein [Pseudonocardia sp. N23]GAY11459.1 hypothetical protein TOK_5969 [Pseudonocardia sp. N23]
MDTVTTLGAGMIMGIGAVLVVVLLPVARGGGPVVGDGLLGQVPAVSTRWVAVVAGAASTATAAAALAVGEPVAGLAAAAFGGLAVFLVDAQRRDPARRPVRRSDGRIPHDGGGAWLLLLLSGDS